MEEYVLFEALIYVSIEQASFFGHTESAMCKCVCGVGWGWRVGYVEMLGRLRDNLT